MAVNNNFSLKIYILEWNESDFVDINRSFDVIPKGRSFMGVTKKQNV